MRSLIDALYCDVQGFGILTGSIVSLITVVGFKGLIENNSILYLDYCWRIIIGFGCVPAVATIYLRYEYALLVSLFTSRCGDLLHSTMSSARKQFSALWTHQVPPEHYTQFDTRSRSAAYPDSS